ncbi:MAG: mandelate racemase/muconate lactonizing enzyme family protein [Thermomicrobiales bacterium]
MKIATIETFGLEAPLATPFAWSQAWVTKRRAVLVRIETDDGIEGWGEIYCQAPPVIYTTIIAELLAPHFLGANPWDREVLWQATYNATIDAGQRGFIVGALSALDIALWDIVGKECGQPVHRLLGGLARRQVQAYATGLYRQPGDDWIAALPAEAVGYVARGFRVVKMKVGFGIALDVEAVRAVRAAIGPDVALAVDANHAYTPVQASELGRRIAPYDIAWFEEPVSPEDIAGYREVRERQLIPVAGGELAYTRFGFRDLLERRAADILQPDLCLCGGLSEGRAIADLARTWNVRCWAHVWGTGIAQATAMHFLGWMPTKSADADVDPLLVEWDNTPNPLRDQIVTNPPVYAAGAVTVPTGPGLGVTIDRAAIARFQTAHSSMGM